MKKEFSTKDREELLNTLKARFEKNTNRHKGLEWPKVQAKLEGKTEKLWSLNGEELIYDRGRISPSSERGLIHSPASWSINHKRIETRRMVTESASCQIKFRVG
jgi:hypothetical protein